jgi:hypothetical protein
MKPPNLDVKLKDLRDVKVAYHRNGVSGNGFHLVSFTHDSKAMGAVVFEEPGDVAVFRLFGIDDKYRGDLFESALREAIATARV